VHEEYHRALARVAEVKKTEHKKKRWTVTPHFLCDIHSSLSLTGMVVEKGEERRTVSNFHWRLIDSVDRMY